MLSSRLPPPSDNSLQPSAEALFEYAAKGATESIRLGCKTIEADTGRIGPGPQRLQISRHALGYKAFALIIICRCRTLLLNRFPVRS